MKDIRVHQFLKKMPDSKWAKFDILIEDIIPQKKGLVKEEE